TKPETLRASPQSNATSSRRRDLNRSAMNVASRWVIASIASDHALILPRHASPAGLNFRKRHLRCQPTPVHIPCGRWLRDCETKLEQFTMDMWCAPEVICTAHRADEIAQLGRDSRPANWLA